MSFYAGVCETNVTPPLNVWMCGYAFRPTGCIGVHDELHARALVVTNGASTTAILAMDLLGLDFDLVEQVRSGITAETGIPPQAILLNATHTHGGPNVREFNTMGTRDPAYVDVLARKLVGVTKQAYGRMQPASLAYGSAPVQIGVNRRQIQATNNQSLIGRNFGGPVAPTVDVLVVRDSRGAPVAVLFSHACHPTTLGGENLEITADFCGYACGSIRQEMGEHIMPMFLQGCCGNVNPEPRGTFEDAERHGRTLGGAVLDAMDQAEPVNLGTPPHIEYMEAAVALPLIRPFTDEMEKNLAHWTAQVEVERRGGNMGRIMHAEGLRDYFEYERRQLENVPASLEKPFTIQRTALGNVQLLGMPGEMFVQYRLDFKRQADGPVFALGFTNGVHGYVPTAADYPFGGYEVNLAHRYYGTLMFTPECEPLIRQTAYDLLGIRQPDMTPYTV
jgi:neutral ceramidase